LCFDAEDCGGLDCRTFEQATEGACSAVCDDLHPCKLGEICFGGSELGDGSLAPLCLQPCQGSEDCAFGFDCVHYLDIATLCLPASWAEIIMHSP
jgi:hypothetical protein